LQWTRAHQSDPLPKQAPTLVGRKGCPAHGPYGADGGGLSVSMIPSSLRSKRLAPLRAECNTFSYWSTDGAMEQRGLGLYGPQALQGGHSCCFRANAIPSFFIIILILFSIKRNNTNYPKHNSGQNAHPCCFSLLFFSFSILLKFSCPFCIFSLHRNRVFRMGKI